MCSQKVACLPAADSHMLYAMALRALSELVMIVIGKVFPLLLLPTLAMGQCDEMPSGACCEADGFFQEADTEVYHFSFQNN